MKRFLALVLSLVMLLTLCPTTWAAEATETDVAEPFVGNGVPDVPEETTLTAPVLAGGESPVVSIVPVGPIELVEGCDGWYEWNETQGKCVFIYDLEYRPEQRYTVTFTHEYAEEKGLASDTFEGSGEDLLFLTWYPIEWNYDQSTPWTVGNTYPATVSLMGTESEAVEIAIVDGPAVSITVDGPVRRIEGQQGDWIEGEDPDSGYFCYFPDDNVTVTVIFTEEWADRNLGGNSTYHGTLGDLDALTGYHWWSDAWERQSSEHHWTGGHTYQTVLYCMGAESAPADIQIVENPIKSISVDKTHVDLIENYDGDWNWDVDGSYFCYDLDAAGGEFVYTVTLTQKGAEIFNGGRNNTTFSGDYQDLYEKFGSWPGWISEQSSAEPWTAGNDYEMTLVYLGVEGSTVSVSVVPSPVESIVPVGPIELVENYDGYYGWDDTMGRDIFIYDPDVHPEQRYTVTFTHEYAQKLGLSSERVNLNRWELQELTGYDVQWLYDQNTPWTAGNTYQAAVSFMGRESAPVDITVMSSPVESIVPVGPIELMENCDGWYGWNESLGRETFIYNPDARSDQRYTVTFSHEYAQKLGLPSEEVTLNSWELYELTGDGAQWLYDQSTPWTAGNTYQVTVSFMGRESEAVDITIVPSPVVSIVPVGAVELTENCDGNWDWDENGSYYRYDPGYWWNARFYTVTLTAEGAAQYTDGVTTLTAADEELWELFGYLPEWNSDQSYENQWKVGKTYQATVSFMGRESEAVNVTVVPSPVRSITVKNAGSLQLMENVYGHWQETDAGDFFWYNPDWFGEIVYTVTLTSTGAARYNGGKTTLTATGEELFDLMKAWPSWHTNQSSDQSGWSRWTVGNTYQATVGFMGKESAPMNVTIVPGPVESIVPVGPVEAMENYDGVWQDDGEQSYFWYNPGYRWYNISYTLTLTPTGAARYNHGVTTLTATGQELEELFGEVPHWNTDQCYENQWTVGNTYQATVGFMGRESAPVDVTIIPSPVTSIVPVGPVELMEDHDGVWQDNGKWSFFWYNPGYWWDARSYTVTLTAAGAAQYNGGETTLTATGRELYEKFGEPPHWENDQSYENQWTAGNTYQATVSFMGRESEEVDVTILPGTKLTLNTEVSDAVLRQYLRDAYDHDRDGKVVAEAVREIWCPGENVRNAECMGLFPELCWVDLSGTGITSLDVRGNTKLEYLDVSDNALTELDLSGNENLTEINCAKNENLTELNVAALENVVLTTALCSDGLKLKEKGKEVTAKLTGTVDLHNPMLEYATVELLDGSGEVVGTSLVVGGNYTVWGVFGAVTVRFSAEGCVSHSCAYAAALDAALVNAGDITSARDAKTGVTDAQDMQVLYEHLSGANVLTDEYALTVADVNGDGSINILDYQALYEAIREEP